MSKKSQKEITEHRIKSGVKISSRESKKAFNEQTNKKQEIMENQQIIDAVNAWQSTEMVHPLTCGNQSQHKKLVPLIINGKVILSCLDCDYKQYHIPEIVLNFTSEKSKAINEKLENIRKDIQLETRLRVRYEMEWLTDNIVPDRHATEEEWKKAYAYGVKMTDIAIKIFNEWEKDGRPESKKADEQN